MLVVGAVSLAAAVIVVGATAVHVLRGGDERGRRKNVLLAATQAGLLTPFGLLLFSYVYAWARSSTGVYAATGVVAFLACGAGLMALPRNAAR